MAILITCGATRNPIDAVRYISAYSSGRTGVAIARALADRNLDPVVFGSPEARLRAGDLPGQAYGSTRDLMERMERWVRGQPAGGLVHAAAVGDYEVPDAADTKTPSKQDRLELVLTPTPKIADHVRDWGLTGPYVTFKAASPETGPDELVDIARAQRDRTGCDLVFGNVLGRLATDVVLVGDEVERFGERADGIAALVAWLQDRLGRHDRL